MKGGDGDAPRVRPSGYRLSRERREGCAGDAPPVRPCPGFPLSRERREGGGGRPARPPLPWVPAFAGTTRGGRGTTRGVVKGGDGDAPRIRPCPGFPLSRERRKGRGNDERGAGDAPRIRPCPGFPLSRERREGDGGRREGS